MTRQQFRDLAELRAEDASALLAASRWSGAYYLAGYAVECGLKACVMKELGRTEGGRLFDPGRANASFQQNACRTHEVSQLLVGAGLRPQFDADVAIEPKLMTNWDVVRDWSEAARYETWTQTEAEALYHAVTDPAAGVLQWIQRFW